MFGKVIVFGLFEIIKKKKQKGRVRTVRGGRDYEKRGICGVTKQDLVQDFD